MMEPTLLHFTSKRSERRMKITQKGTASQQLLSRTPTIVTISTNSKDQDYLLLFFVENSKIQQGRGQRRIEMSAFATGSHETNSFLL